MLCTLFKNKFLFLLEFKESGTKEQEKTIKRSDFVKLQCITRSAAKRALLLQQNSMQK